MSSSLVVQLGALWRLLTEPAASIIDPEARHRAHAVTSTLILSIVIVLITFLQQVSTGALRPAVVSLLMIASAAYGISRTRHYRLAGIIAITILWVAPAFGILIGYSDSPSFILAAARLLLLALLLTYIMFSLRASIVLALVIVAAFVLIPPSGRLATTPAQFASDFLLTAGAIFFLFVITRQYDINERQRAEAAERTSEAQYRAIVEVQTELVTRWLPDMAFTFVNEAYCRYFGVKREMVLGSRALAQVYADDLPNVRQKISQISRAHPSVTYEHRVRNAAGELRWHQWTDQAIFDDAGCIVEYQSVGRDITNLKRAEEAERQQREFAEALTNTAALISSTLNLDEVLDRILSQVALVSPLSSAEVLLIEDGVAHIARTRGYSDDPAQHDEIMKLRFSVDATENLRTMVETGRPLIIPDVRDYPGWDNSDATSWIRASVGAPIRLEGETIGFLSITGDTPGVFTDQHGAWLQAFADQAAIAIRNARLYDQTRRYASGLETLVKERTAELEVAHQRLSAILEGTGEGIFYTETLQLQYVNTAFCRMTGYSEQELIGQPLTLVGDPDDAAQDEQRLHEIREAGQRSNIWRGETRVRRKDGTFFDAALTVGMIGTTPGVSRAVTVVRDISREKQLLLQRSNLVAYASHELRTPITNMKTRLYLLRKRPEYLADHLAILDEVTERMQHLVEDLLDISRLEHGLIPLKRRDIGLQDVIGAVVTMQQPEAEVKQIELRARLPDDPIFVSGDRERLIQVITNLVTNAINYTPSGGLVSIVLKAETGTAQIEVADNGIGIEPENLPYIFQPFYRVVSKVQGTGLGLSIAREIVEMHDGVLDARSEPGRGSVFTITLPLLKPMHVV